MRISDLRHVVFGVGASWQLLMDLPHQPLRRAAGRPEARVGGARVLIWFPVLASANGFLLAATGLLVDALSDRYVAAAAFALLTLVYLLVRHSGRTWVAIVSWTLNMCGGRGFFEALSAVRSDRAQLDRKWSRAVLAVLIGLALTMLFLLGLFGDMFFIAAILAGSSAVQGELMSVLPAEEGGLSDPRRIGRIVMWSIAAASVGAWFFFRPAAAVPVALTMLFSLCWIAGSLRSSLSRFGRDAGLWTVAAAEALMLTCSIWFTM